MHKPLNVVFLGTPDFSIPCLEMLCEHHMTRVSCVVTMPDRPAGRGKKLTAPAVAQFAKERKLNLIQTANINKSEEFSQFCSEEAVDIIIVLAFAQFLGKRVLALPKLGCFNIHTSLLPKYRGAAPIHYALLNGDTETGVTIQKMVKKMDAGDICYSDTVAIAKEESGGQLYTRLKFAAALAINNFLADLGDSKISYTAQNEAEVSFAPTVSKQMGQLLFATENIEVIKNKIRAFDPWPGTFCFLNKRRLKVFAIEVVGDSHNVKVGEVDISQNMLLVGTVDGVVRLVDLQFEGKRRCSDIELLNGLKNSVSDFSIS